MHRNSIRSLLGGLGAALLGFTLPAWSLNIMVTNDDSCNAEGINTLMDVLEAAGHQVTMYAPAGEQSGRGGAISTNIGSSYDISNVGFHGPTSADNRYCVRVPADNPAEGAEDEEITISATPKDSALVGLARMTDNPPDIVVSGINSGQNIGTVAYSSGTVGAAVAAIGKGVPAIAVSRNVFTDEDGMSYTDLARLVADVIAELDAGRAEGAPLLPEDTGLNINNPAGAPRGLVHTTLGGSDLRFGPALNEGGGVSVSFAGVLSLEEIIGDPVLAEELAANPAATLQDFAEAGVDITDEASMSVAGYVTITPLDGDLTAGLRKRELLQLKLREFGAGGE